jgi:Xaa-Pro dipeptidase
LGHRELSCREDKAWQFAGKPEEGVYPHQTERLSEALGRGGLDALVATLPENVAYVTGFRRRGRGHVQAPVFAVFAPGSTALVAPAVEAASVVVDAVEVDHIVSFGGVHAGLDPSSRPRTAVVTAASGWPEGVAVALDHLGVRQGVVGLDESCLAPEAWNRLAAQLSGLRVVTAAGQLAAARRVKGPYEIECLGHALRIAEEALDEVIQTIDRGMTECEVATSLTSEIVKRGAWPHPPLVSIGDRSGTPLSWPTDCALRAGHLVRFEVGCGYKGYCSSVGRTAVLGEPSARQDAVYRAIQAGLDAAIAAVGDGVRAERVLRAAVEAIRANGLPDYHADHVGHGIGLEPCETPVLTSDSVATLELGEVLGVEMAHYEGGPMGMSVKDTVLVTTAGARVLNRSHHALVILD